MKIIRLDSCEDNWSPLASATVKKRSKLHEKALEVIRKVLPATMILNEVAIPIDRKKKLYLDIYLSQHKIAIEVMGKQHKKKVPFFQTKRQFGKQLENDALKKEWCLLNSIVFLEFWFDREDVWELKLREILGLTT